MKSLIKPCEQCHKPMNGGVYRAEHICPHCGFEHSGGKTKRARKELQSKSAASVNKVAPIKKANPKLGEPTQAPAANIKQAETKTVPQKNTAVTADNVALTTKPLDGMKNVDHIKDINANCVLNLELTPDLFENGKFVGAKSAKVKAALQQGKKHALGKLRAAAQTAGANMVTDIAVKNAFKLVDAQKAKVTVSVMGAAVNAQTVKEAIA